MYYKKLEDGTLDPNSKVNYNGFLDIFPSTVFPETIDQTIPKEFLDDVGWVGIEATEMPEDLQETKDKRWVDRPEKNKDGKWVRVIHLEDVKEEDKEKRLEAKWKEIREERDYYLRQTDYTQVGDYPYKDLFLEYRQKLRDITNIDDPFLIKFPPLPEVKKEDK